MSKKRDTEILKEQKRGHLNGISAAVLRTLSTMLIASGLTGVFFVTGECPVFFVPVLTAAAAAAIAFGIDFVTKDRSYGSVLVILAAAALFAASRRSVLIGISVWGSRFRGIWNDVFGTFYDESAVSGYTEGDMAAAGTVLALLAAAVLWELIKRKKLILITAVVFVPLCLSMMLSEELPVFTAASLLTGFMAAWCSISSESGIRLETAVPVIAVWILLIAVSFAGWGTMWQNASAGFRMSVKNTAEKVRFGQDNLPHGNLRNADLMLAAGDEEPRLEIEGDGSETVYLRGFVGADYENNRWKPFAAANYGGKFSGMLTWLHDNGFNPGMQYKDYTEASADDGENAAEKTVSVKNVGASRRYIYLPDTVSSYKGADGKWKQDWSLEASGALGERNYKFTYYDVQKNAETQAPADWLYRDAVSSGQSEFKENELVYRAFVYENYLDIDDDDKALIDGIFFSGEAEAASEGIYTATSRIRTVLRIVAAYEEVPERVPQDRDFLKWFLTEGKEGNSAYYASAAVLAYRAAGIPARYAEGYLLQDEKTAAGEGRIVLTDENAHAWAEVYEDGMGWRAVEVTPGFYEEIYQANIIVAVPNEALTGTNGQTVNIPASEDFKLPDEEPDKAAAEKKGSALIPLLMLMICAVLAYAAARRAYIIYLGAKYGRMTDGEKLRFLYGRIMKAVSKLYGDFNPQHPLDIQTYEELPFDREFYEHTVKRTERMIYGETAPEPREIPAAEELLAQLERELRRRGRLKRMLSEKFGKIALMKG